MGQTPTMFFLLFHMQFKRSCWLAVIGGSQSIVFEAKIPLPMTRTCTVVNFHNLHSLLGQFGSLVFEQTESSD